MNTYLDMSRTDNDTSTIGDLEIIVMQGDTGGNSLSASNMNLTIAGSVSLSSQQLSQSNGILTFKSTPSLSNASSLSVSTVSYTHLTLPTICSV